MNRSDSDGNRWPRIAARVLVVLASVAILLALVAAYARQSAVDSDQFANRAGAALRDDSVRSLLAQKITDEVVLKNEADLIAARPIIDSVASEIIGSRAFTGLFRRAVRDVHRALFKRDKASVTLTIADVGTVLAAALEQVRPALARELRSTERVEVVRENIGSLSATLVNIAERVQILAILLIVIALVLGAGALIVAPDKRDTVIELGLGAAAAGGLLVVAYAIAHTAVVDQLEGPEEQAAARAVWDAFLGEVRTEAWILAGSGAVIAAAASSLIKPLPFGEPLRVAGAWLAREPRSRSAKALRGLGVIAAGVLVLVHTNAVLTLVLNALGIYLIYEGVSAILRLVYRPEAHPERRPAPGPLRRFDLRRLAIGLVPVVVIVPVVAAFLGTGGTTTAAPAAGGCNGHEELCERPFDRVVLPMTHNSMSVPLPGWYSSMQEKPIADQLRDGIRGLMIDTHYADRLPNGKVRTYFGSREELKRRTKVDGVSPDAVDAALNLRDRLGFSGEARARHVPLPLFLRARRNPARFRAGRSPDLSRGEPWRGRRRHQPGLRDGGGLRRSGSGRRPGGARLQGARGRRVADASRDGCVEPAPGPPGGEPRRRGALLPRRLRQDHPGDPVRLQKGRPAYETGQPRQELRAEPRAGGRARLPGEPLDHDRPGATPSNASKVNAYDPILARVRDCQRIRHHLTNLVSVNFYLRGDLFKVVDTLNGLD